MLRIEVGPSDIASSRFAVSPTFELAHLLRTLYRAAPRSAIGRRFHRGFAALHDDPVVQTFAWLQGPGAGASFSAPPPTAMAQTIDDDLAVIRGADPAVVADEVAEIRAL